MRRYSQCAAVVMLLSLTAGCQFGWMESRAAEPVLSGRVMHHVYQPGSLLSQVYGSGEQALKPQDPLGQPDSLRGGGLADE